MNTANRNVLQQTVLVQNSGIEIKIIANFAIQLV